MIDLVRTISGEQLDFDEGHRDRRSAAVGDGYPG
jgi:hypothetical protein